MVELEPVSAFDPEPGYSAMGKWTIIDFLTRNDLPIDLSEARLGKNEVIPKKPVRLLGGTLRRGNVCEFVC